MTTTDNLIGKEFILNNFICTIKSIDENFITYSFRNKAGDKFPDGKVVIDFLPKIIAQLKASNK